MKFSILMPAYNDSKYIAESIKSVISQTYDNWELIIIDDGSTDTTSAIVKSFMDKRIKYIYQKNADQLNALITGSRDIIGEIVMLLHSDDLLADDSVISEMNEFFSVNEDADGLYADYIKIDKDSNKTGNIYTGTISNNIIKSLFLTRGSNPIGDHFSVRRNIFTDIIFRNYLTDNIIYYIDYEKADLIKLNKFRPWYKYRVTDENYASNEIGKFVETNGRMRILFSLMKHNHCLKPYIQNNYLKRISNRFFIYNFFNIVNNEQIDWKYIISYFGSWKKDLVKNSFPELSILMIDKIIDSSMSCLHNKNLKPLIIKYHGEKIYYGKDARSFFRDYHNGSLNNFVAQFLKADFDHIVAEDEKTAEAAIKVLNFYCMFYKIRVSG